MRRLSRLPNGVPRISCLFALTCAVFAVGGKPATAQSLWELSPYRVRVVLLAPPSSAWTSQMLPRVERTIRDGCSATVGASWEVTVDAASINTTPIASATFAGMADPPMSPEALVDDIAALDKLFVLSIQRKDDAYLILAREYDVRTQIWSPVVERQTALAEELGELGFHLLIDTFSPLALIVSTENKSATLRMRGGALPTRDPTLRFVGPGDLFRPIVRYNDRDGTPRRIQSIPWTFLLVDTIEDTDVDCRVVTGLRSPLSARRRGRVEQLAAKMRFSPSATRVNLRSPTEPQSPLVGFAVYAYGPDSPETVLLGRTDRMGQITVPPGDDPLRILLVKNGTALVAKLPLVPGFLDQLEAVVPDDRTRLRVEAEITGIQEALVDFVAEREILMARAERRIEQGEIDEARGHVDELARLSTDQNFRFRLRQLRQGVASDDPRTRQRIEQLIDDTQQLVDEYLDSQRVDALRESLRQAQNTARRDAS